VIVVLFFYNTSA